MLYSASFLFAIASNSEEVAQYFQSIGADSVEIDECIEDNVEIDLENTSYYYKGRFHISTEDKSKFIDLLKVAFENSFENLFTVNWNGKEYDEESMNYPEEIAFLYV